MRLQDEEEKPIPRPRPFMGFAWEPKDAPVVGYPTTIQGVVRFDIEKDFVYVKLHTN